MKKDIYILLIIFIGILFVFTNFLLIAKDPPVYTDEVSYATYAYRLFHPDDFGKQAFERRLTVADQQIGTLYGPVYPVLSGLFYKFFGLSVYSVRLFSLLVAVLSLILLFFLLNATIDNRFLSWLTVLLVGIDMNFLRSARFGRPEILVILFTLAAFLYYLRGYRNLSAGRYILLDVLILLTLLTHYLLGLIVLLSVLAHIILVDRRWRSVGKLVCFMVVPVGAALWGWLYLAVSRAGETTLTISYNLVRQRLWPDWFLFKVIINDRLTFNFVTFALYLAGLILLIGYGGKLRHKLIWLVFAVVSFLVVAYGSVFFYAGFVPVFFIPLLAIVYQGRVRDEGKDGLVRLISGGLIGMLVVVSVLQQVRLWNYYRNYSYSDLGRQVSDCIPAGKQNVYFTHLMPNDPYLYLVANRPQLSLAYRKYQDVEGVGMRRDLPKADYAVVSGGYVLLYNEDLTEREIELYGLDPVTVEILANRTGLVCSVALRDSPVLMVVAKVL